MLTKVDSQKIERQGAKQKNYEQKIDFKAQLLLVFCCWKAKGTETQTCEALLQLSISWSKCTAVKPTTDRRLAARLLSLLLFAPKSLLIIYLET